jgi:hypothetical protein
MDREQVRTVEKFLNYAKGGVDLRKTLSPPTTGLFGTTLKLLNLSFVETIDSVSTGLRVFVGADAMWEIEPEPTGFRF